MHVTEITSFVSDVAVTAAALFMLFNHTQYSMKSISLAWLMMLASITWGVIPLWMNDILYDFSYIYIALYLVSECYQKNRVLTRLMKNEQHAACGIHPSGKMVQESDMDSHTGLQK